MRPSQNGIAASCQQLLASFISGAGYAAERILGKIAQSFTSTVLCARAACEDQTLRCFCNRHGGSGEGSGPAACGDYSARCLGQLEDVCWGLLLTVFTSVQETYAGPDNHKLAL